jgi:hypothetical protein
MGCLLCDHLGVVFKGVEIQNSRGQKPMEDSDNSEKFVIEISQTDVVKKEFNV